MALANPDGSGAETPRPETIEALFAALESPLLNYALRLLPDADMAQDVVQEAFVRLHAHRATVREPRSWLYRTVHNLALNQQRKACKVVPLTKSGPEGGEVETELPDPGLLPDEAIARSEGIGLVRLGLQNLDDRSQELLRLKFNEGLSYRQISARTGLTVSHVGYLLHHSLKALAAELSRAGLVA